MRHRANTAFWQKYWTLPPTIRSRADKQFALLKADPHHPSLQFKKIGERYGHEIWAARVTLDFRALAMKRADGYLWFWIGDHEVYDYMIS